MQDEKKLSIQEMKTEIDTQLESKETLNTLMAITFKGLQPEVAKRAMLEAMMRGYTFHDFLEKNVYAIPFSGGYSLVSSIDHYRKIGMRSGVCGKTAPVFEMDGKNIVSCTITIKKAMNRTGGDVLIGDFSATAFFLEYNTGKQQWAQKPRTMIAKVAEMHALRMACPEELSQSYIEEEVNDKVYVEAAEVTNIQADTKKEVNTEKAELLFELVGKAGKTVDQLLKHLKKEKLTDLTETEMDTWIDKFEKEIQAVMEKKMKEVAPVEGEIIIEDMPVEPKKKTEAQLKMDKLIAERKAKAKTGATPVAVTGAIPGDVCQLINAIEKIEEIELAEDILKLKTDCNRGEFAGYDSYPSIDGYFIKHNIIKE